MYVNKEHLEFLDRFTYVKDWLGLNGFSLIYTHEYPQMRQVYTVWSDRTSEPDDTGLTDAQHFLMVVYCRECDTVEVYNRAVIFSKANEKQAFAELSNHFAAVPVSMDDILSEEDISDSE